MRRSSLLQNEAGRLIQVTKQRMDVNPNILRVFEFNLELTEM